jgi:hypothetical protein
MDSLVKMSAPYFIFQTSLFFSLLAGNSGGDRFAIDCVVSQSVPSFAKIFEFSPSRTRRKLCGDLSFNWGALMGDRDLG